MDIWTVVAKVLVSLVAIVTVVGGALADLVIPTTARQHMHNPSFPPHAKFHNGQTIWLGVFSGLLAIFLLWFPERDWVFQFHLAVMIAALYSLTCSSLRISWAEPRFTSKTRFCGHYQCRGTMMERNAFVKL